LSGRASGQRLPATVESIASCGNYLKVLVLNVSRASTAEYDLTPRQVEILDLIGRGLSNRDIGEVLGISINTVKAHAKNIYGKLGVHGRMQAAQRAAELNLIAR
ncbi:MAG: response regulator transcription factor, partial [bacterium]